MAYSELTTSRQMGMGLGYIPYSEICFWLDENQIWGMTDRKRFRHFINLIDRHYVNLENEKSKSKKNKPSLKKK